MFRKSICNEEYYNDLMECIKIENRELKNCEKSFGMRLDKTLRVIQNCFNDGNWKLLRKYIHNQVQQKRVRRKFPRSVLENNNNTKISYLSDYKIAIYTCIIGAYDEISEPLFCPDNCDFYIITDQYIQRDSKWKKIDIKSYENNIKGLSNPEINRYFKMHPDVVFVDYQYSIYLDGNIQPVSDLTEFINRIGECGIAAHKHCLRNCVYDEAEVLMFLKKDDPIRIKTHLEYLADSGMPRQYGLIECNVIARQHHNPICKTVMDVWWNEFMSYSKRDQISFMHALYLNGIDVNEVATLGNNVYQNNAIRKNGHN